MMRKFAIAALLIAGLAVSASVFAQAATPKSAGKAAKITAEAVKAPSASKKVISKPKTASAGRTAS